MDKNTQNTRKMVLAALLTCLGLLFPYITAHAFALAGTVLLPMHIPVLLCGFLCGPKYGGLCGLLTPVLSCMLTGMPVAYPMLPIMICELVAYGLIAGWAYQKRHFPIYPALLLAMLAGRCAYGAAFAGLLLAATGPLQALSVTAAVVTGLPGILLQLIVVPLLVRLIQKTRWGRVQGVPDIVQLLDFWEEPAMVQAKTAIKNGKAGCMYYGKDKRSGRRIAAVSLVY